MNGKNCAYQNREVVCGDLAIRPLYFELGKGENLEGIDDHDHPDGHVSVIINGSGLGTNGVKGTPEYKEKVFKQGEMFLSPAGVMHSFKALEDNTIVFCIFSKYNEKGEVTKEFADISRDVITGWEPSKE